jgi:hypothetical protein
MAEVLRDRSKLDRCEELFQTHDLLRLEKQMERIMSAYLLPRDAFDDMANVVGATELEKRREEVLNRVAPIGTAEWVFEVFPEAKAHFCRLMIDADEAYNVLRDMTANYNYTGIEAEEIPSFLSFINDFCNVLRPLSKIQTARARAIAHTNRRELPHRKDETGSSKAA